MRSRLQAIANCSHLFRLPFSISSPHFLDQARKLFAYPFSISARSCISCCRSLQSLCRQIREREGEQTEREKERVRQVNNRFFVIAGNDPTVFTICILFYSLVAIFDAFGGAFVIARLPEGITSSLQKLIIAVVGHFL